MRHQDDVRAGPGLDGGRDARLEVIEVDGLEAHGRFHLPVVFRDLPPELHVAFGDEGNRVEQMQLPRLRVRGRRPAGENSLEPARHDGEPRRAARLEEGPAVDSPSPDRFTVVGNVRLATRRLAPRFRFNDEESLRAEHDVVEVDLLPDDVVKHAGPSVAYLFQILSDGPLAIAAKLQAL